jgi:hypothetical protein
MDIWLSMGATRQQRHRQRKRAGAFVISMEIRRDAIDALIVRGLLAEIDRSDRHAVGAAIAHALTDLLIPAQPST